MWKGSVPFASRVRDVRDRFWYLYQILRHLPSLLLDSARRFHRRRGNHLAAAISFFTILSLVPMILLLSSLLGMVLTGHNQLQKEILAVAGKIIPVWELETRRSIHFLQDNQGTLGVLGVCTMYLTSRSLVAGVNFAFDTVLDVEEPKSFWKIHTDTFLMLSGFILMAIGTALFNIGYQIFQQLSVPDELRYTLSVFFSGTGWLSSYLISTLMFVLFFRIIPSQKLSLENVLVAGAGSALLWEIGKMVFSTYLIHVIERYKIIYGSVSGMVFAVMWSYLFGLALVCGISFAGSVKARADEFRADEPYRF